MSTLNRIVSQAAGLPSWVVLLAMVVLASILVLASVRKLQTVRRRREEGSPPPFTEARRIYAALSEQRVTSLRNEVLTAEIRERQKIEAKLVHLAFHDSVTGLHNRAYLIEQLQVLLRSQPEKRGGIAGMLFIDLDKFKVVNDMLGHAYGDKLLEQVGQRLRRCVSKEDTIARMGGDEFVVLIRDMKTEGKGIRLAQRILAVLEEPCELASTTFNISASIGLCSLSKGYSSPDVLLRDADLAMYQAKREGGAKVVPYRAEMAAEAHAAMQAKQELKGAIENSEFEVYYQPLVDMRDNSICGMEALVRWNHPSRGLVSPATFIPLSEETGDIVDIGAWVLRRACQDYKDFRKAASGSLLLSVNVSTRQLQQSDFVDILQNVLTETGIPPRCLQLEIMESILLMDAVRIGALFQEIRSLGVKLAFDDFGTGYSSLSYIERYPIDTLKIDQSFVRNMNTSPVNTEIIKLMIGVAEVMGMKVSAEGVENPEEATTLVSMGCCIAQGFCYSRPVPKLAMLAMIGDGISAEARQRKGNLLQISTRAGWAR